MFTRTHFKNEVLSLIVLATASSVLGCGSASAMGHAQTPAASSPASNSSAPVVAPNSAAVDPSSLGGDFTDGYAVGERNGAILIERLKQRTTDAQGCGAIDLLENALVRVTRTVRPPLHALSYIFLSLYFSLLVS